MEIKGKTILITGASRGIGAAVAIEAAKKGAKRVVLLARTQEDMNKVAEKVKALGAEAVIYAVDLASPESTRLTIEKVISDGNLPDILVNNAGAGRWLFLQETSMEEADFMMQLPFGAALRVTTLLLPAFVKRRTGHILNVGSPASLVPWPGSTAYTASRWGLRGLADALQTDFRGTGIGVTNFVAGEVTSNYFEANPGSHERIPAIAKIIPVMSPEKAAQHIIFAIEKNKRTYFVPLMLRLIYWSYSITPGLVRWLVWKTGYRPGF